jgi:hypothetical protein
MQVGESCIKAHTIVDFQKTFHSLLKKKLTKTDVENAYIPANFKKFRSMFEADQECRRIHQKIVSNTRHQIQIIKRRIFDDPDLNREAESNKEVYAFLNFCGM